VKRSCGLLVAALLAATVTRADEAPRFVGDLGLGVERAQAIAPGAAARTWVMPYVYGDLGRSFVREDTFGVKTVAIGWGALEAVARISTEGSDSDGPGLAHRTNPRPVGLGTFQETPWGGVFIDAFVDTVSGGTLLEASYAAEIAAGPLTVYPQAGVTRRSARYEAHLYDVHAASTTPVVQLSGELPIAQAWVVLAHVQYEPFDDAVRASARVAASSHTSALVALAWRFL
jgi:outer membrane protein